MSSLNFGASNVTVAPAPATSGVTVTVTAGTGTSFTPGKASVFPAGRIPTRATAEVWTITSVTGDVLTVLRAQEGSTARTVLPGDQVVQGITAAMWDTLNATAAGALQAGNSLSELAGSPAPARGNLGLGTAAVHAATDFDAAGVAAAAVATETTRAQAAEALLAPTTSPTFAGIPAVPTASPGTSTIQAASTAFVAAAVATINGGTP